MITQSVDDLETKLQRIEQLQADVAQRTATLTEWLAREAKTIQSEQDNLKSSLASTKQEVEKLKTNLLDAHEVELGVGA